MLNIISILDNLKVGSALKNSTTWKNNSIILNGIVGILAIIPQVTNIALTVEQENILAYGIVTIASFINSYIHVATSEKVGL
jgi:hypothetical protein